MKQSSENPGEGLVRFSVEQLIATYQQFDGSLIEKLPELYANDVKFIDPFHQINGLKNLQGYFSHMMKNLSYCHFDFHHWIAQAGRQEAVLFWTMEYSHPRLAGGKYLQLQGNSHIRVEEKICFHRDYFDTAAMLYEQLPVMGFFIKKIKQRMS